MPWSFTLSMQLPVAARIFCMLSPTYLLYLCLGPLLQLTSPLPASLLSALAGPLYANPAGVFWLWPAWMTVLFATSVVFLLLFFNPFECWLKRTEVQTPDTRRSNLWGWDPDLLVFNHLLMWLWFWPKSEEHEVDLEMLCRSIYLLKGLFLVSSNKLETSLGQIWASFFLCRVAHICVKVRVVLVRWSSAAGPASGSSQ